METQAEITKIKKILDIPHNNFDDIFEDLLLGSLFFLSRLVGQSLQTKTYTEVFNGGSESFLAGHSPIKSITKLEYKISGAWETQALNSLLDHDEQNIYLDSPKGKRNVRIEYLAGYDVLPVDLLLLVRKFTLRQWRKLKNEGEKTTNYVNSSLTWDDLVNKDDEKIIQSYQRYFIL